MNQKKNIDRLYQEKFKDFEVFPEASVWQNIEKELVKKKRRIVPLWLRLGGAAAILIFLITSYWYTNQNTIVPKQGTDTISKSKKDLPKTKKSDIINLKSDKNDEVVTSTKENQQNNGIVEQEELANTTKNQQDLKAKKYEINTIKNNITYQDKNKEIEQVLQKQKSQKNKLKLQNNSVKEDVVVVQENIDLKLPKKDIQNEITAQENTDELAITTKNIKNKWSVGSIISPVYYNTLSGGSPIDPSLASNNKSNTSSLSYGLKINYKLSDKLSFQAGINNLELGYSTANVATLISSSLLDNTATNINTNIENVSIAALSTNVQGSEASSGRSSFDVDGTLNQSFNYIEIPLEVKYTILQKKLSVNAIGGFSTYFLYENIVTATSFGKTSTLGQANNLNNTNFSGNLGLDLEYNISKKIFINVSPMFKYQFNTFSKNSGGFKPYYLGVYSGVNFRF